ncbi:MAG: tRNA dihydrouridine synthase DusB [Bdellovibrionales bacterium]|nr:tRNA dihydrouridine synthase DusB [Bdellovibrionales bacterium]
MTEQELLENLRRNPFVLAPMAGITDRPFRSFMREMGCGIVVSELVSATGLKFSSAKTLKLMEFDSTQHPVGIQLFGENFEHLTDAAKMVEQMGADFVDLNFGCPVPKVVNKGAGSACLKDLTRLRDVIRAAKSGIQIPLTIKIRTGWDAHTRNSHEVLQVAADEGVTWVAIHGRTRAAAYTGLADWDYIREVKAQAKVPVLGNGDIVTARQAVGRLQTSACDAVMIGRGCLKNPRIFREALALRAEVQSENVPLEKIVSRLCDHLEGFYDERLTLIQMRKFASWYSSGFPGAAAFRKEIFQLHERSETLDRIHGFFAELNEVAQSDTSHEAFLMGGHG